MGIIPIFIHVRERSNKEILADIKREAKWRELIEEDERRKREREEKRKRMEREKEEERQRKIEEEYWILEMEDQWQTRILPEGWSIWGQTSFPIIREHYVDPKYRKK